MRLTAFLFDDGIVLAATLRALREIGILEPSLRGGGSLRGLARGRLDLSGFGYIRAGLRSLAGQGWLASEPTLDPATTEVRWTEAGRAAAGSRDHYVALGSFLSRFSGNAPDAWSERWDEARKADFLALLEPCLRRWDLGERLPAGLRATIGAHLDAALAVPTMLSLHGTGRLAAHGPRLPDGELGRGFGELLLTLGWTGPEGAWTDLGQQARAYAVHFGIVGSYLPLLARLPELYRGELRVGAQQGESVEWHVNRELNVIASAAAHRRYFADADHVFLDLFDREPLDAQPRFIADVGCGDGSWLIHLYRLIEQRTLRGRMLDSHPLRMVGVDCNPVALEPARRALDAAGVPDLLLFGDVSDPESLRSTLAEHGLRMEEGLHVRSFLDHDRAYATPDPGVPVPGDSSGAYVDADGRALDPADVERDLVAHLRRWAPFVRRHGLVVLEAHCVATSVARRHLGALHSGAFDAYHAYSHQYPIEYSSFIRCCRAAGLERLGHLERHYPTSRPFVAVSLNRLLASDPSAGLPAQGGRDAGADTWQPPPDLDRGDGRAMHRFLFSDGDLARPRLWCTTPTGHVVAGAIEAIEARLASAERGSVIRVLDYGTGTGLAAIELLKACRERGIEERLDRRGARLELHLVDLPASWFAQAYDLLRGCAWTAFHSLTGADGAFRPLLEVTGGRTVDVVMSNMVFHLIPPRALPPAIESLAGAIAPGGRLRWSSPDLGPPEPLAVLFHDPNRALRARWLELIVPPLPDPPRPRRRRRRPSAPVREAIALARNLDPKSRSTAQERANRRILPRANAAADLESALAPHLSGGLERHTYEMLDDEVLEGLLVPSNQAEFLSEVTDGSLREEVIRELMLDEVLPAIREGPAGTALGINVQWTFGDFSRPPGASQAAGAGRGSS